MKKFLFPVSAWAVWSVASLAWSFEPLPDAPPVPADNPMSAAKVALGQQLYFDKRLSVDGTVSCNSCHSDGERNGQPTGLRGCWWKKGGA